VYNVHSPIPSNNISIFSDILLENDFSPSDFNQTIREYKWTPDMISAAVFISIPLFISLFFQ